MYVSSLHIYPIKSCRGVAVERARLELWGLAGDRRWMVVDETGRYVSQREHPRLARVVAQLTEGGVEVSVDTNTGGGGEVPDGMEPLAVKEPDPADGAKPVRVWGRSLEGVDAAPEAHAWFSEYLSAHVRLVWLDDPLRMRPYAGYGTLSAFSDGFPLLVTNEGSLAALNDWLVEAGDDPVPMNRFRPNLVVSGAEAWAEDGWTDSAGVRLRTPDGLELRGTKPCGRCVVTTTDQTTGERRGPQPLRLLTQRRRFGKHAVFGMNMAPTHTSSLKTGTPLTPVRIKH